jgi:cell division protein FtsB
MQYSGQYQGQQYMDQYNYAPQAAFMEEQCFDNALLPKKHLARNFLFNLTVFILVVAFLVVYLVQHIKVMDLNFQYQKLEKEFFQIRHENEKMQIILAKDMSLGNIDSLAVNKLGMVRPKYIEYIIYSDVK